MLQAKLIKDHTPLDHESNFCVCLYNLCSEALPDRNSFYLIVVLAFKVSPTFIEMIRLQRKRESTSWQNANTKHSWNSQLNSVYDRSIQKLWSNTFLVPFFKCYKTKFFWLVSNIQAVHARLKLQKNVRNTSNQDLQICKIKQLT